MQKKASRTKLATINISTSIFYRIINTLSNMILPPLIISFFGSSINGLIASIRDLLKYAQLFGSGISASSMQEMYRPIEIKDRSTVSKMYNVVKETFNKSGIWFSLCVIIIAGIYPLFVYKENFLLSASLVIILGIAGAIELFFVGKYRTILGAHQKGYIVTLSLSFGAILNVIISVILLYTTRNIIIVQFGGTIIYLVRLLIPVLYIRKHFSFLNQENGKDYTAIRKRMDAVVHSLMGTITLSSQTIIIALMLNLQIASIYSIYNLVFYGIYSIISSLTLSATSSFGSLIATGNENRVKEVYKIYTYAFYVFMFTIFVTAGLVFFDFLDLYLSSGTDISYVDHKLLYLFIFVGVLNTIRIPALTMINASGHFKETRNGAIYESIISIIFQVSLVLVIGVYGILIGTLVALLFRSNQLIMYTNKSILNLKKFNGYLYIIVNSIIGIVILWLFQKYTISFLDLTNWFNFIVNSGIVFILVAIVYFMINSFLRREDFINGYGHLKKIIFKRRK